VKTNWLPWFFGGTGSFVNFSNNLPFTEIPEGVIDYYMFELGYMIGATVEHLFFEEKTNDFTMYILHHYCALSLVIASYIANYVGIGTMVLFSLDIADIFTNSSSLFGQTVYDGMAACHFITMMIIWVYTRLLCLPYIVYYLFSDQHAM
jgi:hypothetical protein